MCYRMRYIINANYYINNPAGIDVEMSYNVTFTYIYMVYLLYLTIF